VQACIDLVKMNWNLCAGLFLDMVEVIMKYALKDIGVEHAQRTVAMPEIVEAESDHERIASRAIKIRKSRSPAVFVDTGDLPEAYLRRLYGFGAGTQIWSRSDAIRLAEQRHHHRRSSRRRCPGNNLQVKGQLM
jgi:hypothetical protein